MEFTGHGIAEAAEADNIEFIQQFIATANINQQFPDWSNNTALGIVIFQSWNHPTPQQHDMVTRLMNAGADPNAADDVIGLTVDGRYSCNVWL